MTLNMKRMRDFQILIEEPRSEYSSVWYRTRHSKFDLPWFCQQAEQLRVFEAACTPVYPGVPTAVLDFLFSLLMECPKSQSPMSGLRPFSELSSGAFASLTSLQQAACRALKLVVSALQYSHDPSMPLACPCCGITRPASETVRCGCTCLRDRVGSGSQGSVVCACRQAYLQHV